MHFKQSTFLISKFLIPLLMLCVGGCYEENVTTLSQNPDDPDSLDQLIAENIDSEQKEQVIEGIQALRQRDYKTASRVFNTILIDDPTNSALHTLNALTYQLRGKEGDIAAADLAVAGYEQAKGANPNNVIAYIQLGRIQADKKNYLKAQEEFSEALLLEPNNTEALYELSSTSYLMGDLKTACMSIDRLLKISPTKPEYIRAGALIYAAVGKKEKTQKLLATYKNVEPSNRKRHHLEQRVQDWHHLHANGGIVVAQADSAMPNFDAASPNQDPAQAEAAAAAAQAAAAQAAAAQVPAHPPAGNQNNHQKPGERDQTVYEEPEEDMVDIDGVVLRSSQDGSTLKGNNILTNFTATISPYTKVKAKHASAVTAITTPPILQATTVPGTTQAIAQSSVATALLGDGGTKSVVKVLAKGVSLNTITYGLNIANATSTYVEIIARPTLTTKIGKAAEFFTGSETRIAISGNFGGNITTTPTGNTLKVTPLSIENGYVTLDVELIGSFLTETDEVIASRAATLTPLVFSLDKSSVKTTVRVKTGETIMLAGTVERTDLSRTSGFPVLKDIPLVQYLFSQNANQSNRKWVIYMITVRSRRENLKDTKAYFARGEEEDYRPNLSELEKRYQDWFDPHQNYICILRGLDHVYRDFRGGDFIPVYWYYPVQLDDTLRQIIAFLWY
jgi:tetratricopeptide (TPR) repeat protein